MLQLSFQSRAFRADIMAPFKGLFYLPERRRQKDTANKCAALGAELSVLTQPLSISISKTSEKLTEYDCVNAQTCLPSTALTRLVGETVPPPPAPLPPMAAAMSLVMVFNSSPAPSEKAPEFR